MIVVIFYRLFEMDDNAEPSGTFNRTQVQNDRRKEMPGIEWDYAINIGDQFIDWQCKSCHASKLGGAPHLREHFLGGPKNCFTCPRPSALVVAEHLREEIQKKEPRNPYTYFLLLQCCQKIKVPIKKPHTPCQLVLLLMYSQKAIYPMRLL